MRTEVPIPHLIHEEFEKTSNKYFESEPIFSTSDIEEDYVRLDFGPKFDLSDVEDED